MAARTNSPGRVERRAGFGNENAFVYVGYYEIEAETKVGALVEL